MQESTTSQQSAAKPANSKWTTRLAAFLAAIFLVASLAAPAALAQSADTAKPPTHITPDQAKQLFSLVDELIQFSSTETGLPVKSPVKRQLTTRTAVESYLQEKFNDDQDAKRLQRAEIVLKKFGLLDRDFNLKPFLLALLKEQIEAYYDSKTKTVNMLDWIGIDEQKPVLAHELTHALQDQHTDLEKWGDQTPEDVSLNSAGDTDHILRDEMDGARDAVAEGQATAVMMDYILKPSGKTLVKDPEVMDILKQQMSGGDNSPVMARAPLLLSESLLFPYREGLSFEQDVWMDQGQAAAFAGALDHPPTSSWEIINPREYEKRHIPAVPLLPNIHPLVDQLYAPYDIGQMGQLDVNILTKLIGGDQAARNLTPAWNGGIYWAGQLRSAKSAADQSSTKSLALFYLSAWRNSASAQAFAKLYADSLGRKYSGLKLDDSAQASTPTESGSIEQVYSTSEGPVVITTRRNLVFVSESFPLPLARQLAGLILDAQGSGEMKMAATTSPPTTFGNQLGAPSLRLLSGARVGDEELHFTIQPGASGPGSPRTGLRPWSEGLTSETHDSLTASLVRFFANCGVMKSVVEAALMQGK